ncbi:MAG: DUF4411 family protein [Cyclobacteriaceae bacterium]
MSPKQLSFLNQDKTIYVIDANALIHLERHFPKNNSAFAAIWEEIEALMAVGSFITLDYVEEEINSYAGHRTFLQTWIKDCKKEFVVATDEICFNAARPIINQEYSTGFFDAKKQADGKEEADPYLIAYCQINGCTLITNESKMHPHRIPAVAKKLNVKCIDIADFLEERGLRMQRRAETPP